jgi:predicted alpha-1,2-mannosidase
MHVNQLDTRLGTKNTHYFSNGNCLPLTGVPFGMNFFAPQTTNQSSWWFDPTEPIFQGFRLTHQPSPWIGDFSSFVMLPVSGVVNASFLEEAQSSYRPDQSTFQPNLLRIQELRYGIQSTLIPSCYGGILDIHYTKDASQLLLSLPGKFQLEQLDDTTIQGSVVNLTSSEDDNLTFYFIFKFSEALQSIQKITNYENLIYLNFGEISQQTTQFATSFISAEQAALNLSRELDWTLADYQLSSTSTWNNQLAKIDITHHDAALTKTFYQNLYRLFLFPQRFYERNELDHPIHYNTLAKKIAPGFLYTNNGFWDTFRSVYPLFSLIAVHEYEEMLAGFLTSYRETGFLPKWLSPDERGMMPGTLIDAVIADAATKGIAKNLMPEFLEAMLKSATVESEDTKYGRQKTATYQALGYIPNDAEESVSHTLDYSYSDFCIAQVAQTLNQPELAEKYQHLALNYQALIDPTTKFMVGKNKAGAFRAPFNDHDWGYDYAEGSAWQSSFAVYHDMHGLIKAYGSPQAFTERLIELVNQEPTFNVGRYGMEIHEMSEMAAIEFGQLAISNQPSFHLPYLFSFVGKPEMSQPLLKQLMTQNFDASFTGYPGDEDNGSLAGWFLFSSLGFYPVAPATTQYVIGMPLFDRAVLHLSNGHDVVLTSTPNQTQQQFIDQITVNQKPYDKLYFTHQDLLAGIAIDFKLGVVPHPREYTAKQLPYSLSKKS